MTATAHGKGGEGGVHRRRHPRHRLILEKPFPVYYKHRIPGGPPGRRLVTHYQIPIKIGGVLVRVDEIRENEKQILGWIAEGQSIHEITEIGGYF